MNNNKDNGKGSKEAKPSDTGKSENGKGAKEAKPGDSGRSGSEHYKLDNLKDKTSGKPAEPTKPEVNSPPKDVQDAEDFNNIKDPFEKRNAAMKIMENNKNMLDKASSKNNDGTNSNEGTDGKFNIQDFNNLAKNDKAPKDVAAASGYIANNDDMLRNIDGKLDKVNGYSNGNFTWDDFKRAQNDFKNPNFKLSGYDNDARKPVNGKLDEQYGQAKRGNCFSISAAGVAFGNPKGEEILNKTITAKDDGSYDVVFQGDSKTIYNVKED